MEIEEQNRPHGENTNQEAAVERNCTWEANHDNLKWSMIRLIRKLERWPTIAQLVEETGLSRSTVYNHLQNFRKEDMLGDELEEIKFMGSNVMARMVECAMNGDIKAMRLAFEVMGILKKGKTAGKELAGRVEL